MRILIPTVGVAVFTAIVCTGEIEVEHAREHPIARIHEHPAEMVIDLINGIRLIGVPVDPVLRVQCAFGEFELPFERLAQAKFAGGKPTQFIFRNKDRVTGTWKRSTIVLKTVIGEITVPNKRIEGIHVRHDGSSINFRQWNDPINGLQSRLSLLPSNARVGGEVVLKYEIRNTTGKVIKMPYPRVGQSVREFGRGVDSAPIEIVARYTGRADAAKRRALDIAQQIWSPQWVNMPPLSITTIIITLSIPNQEVEVVARMLEALEALEALEGQPDRTRPAPAIIRTKFRWSMARPGPYMVHVQMQCDGGKAGRAWRGLLITPEMKVTIAR